MKKILVLIALCTISAAGHAQRNEIYLRSVGIDSLLSFVKNNIEPGLYYSVDSEDDKSNYTVQAAADSFFDAAMKEVAAKGYSVTSFDGKWFVLRNAGFSTLLPFGYFEEEKTPTQDTLLLKYLNDKNVIASMQNKIYEIGDRNSGKRGKVYVSGYVRDVSTGEPAVGVSVYDETSTCFAQTDAYGFYKLFIPVGEHQIGYSGYGLDDVKLNVMLYDDGGLDVMMKERVYALTGAVISAESMTAHRNASMGVEKVRISAIRNVPAVFGESDVLKVVLTLPGVKSVGEAANGFNVRGGSTDQNLILFNDGTIYNPSHMFGILSAFNTDVISDIELYKSSIPAEYGGRISSVLEVRGREGNSKKITGSLGLGLLTSRLHLEGPIVKEKTTFIVGARTTYSNWMLKLLPASGGYHNGNASFYDINASVSHKFNKNNSIHAYGYCSRDRFGFNNDTTYRYSNMNASLKWRCNINDRHSFETSAGFDRYGYSVENVHNEAEAYNMSSRIAQGFFKIRFKSMLFDRNTLSYGLNTIYYDLQPGKYLPFDEKSIVEPKILNAENANESALYVSDSWQPTDALSFDAGIRYSAYMALHPNKFYGGPEWRISGKYSPLNNFSIKAGFNTMRQYIHMITNSTNISPTDTWKLCDENVKPQLGWQAAGGLYWTIAGNTIDLSLEGYYKKMKNVLDYKSGAVLTMNENLAESLIEAEGKAYGVEFMIKKPLGKLNGWISYTYSRAFLKEMNDRGVETVNNGEWYCAPYDKPHDVKLVGNYKFTHRYSVSFNLDYSTGRPVTIPVGKYEYAGGYRLVYSERNGYRIPDYFRLDLAVNIEPGHYLKQLTHFSITFGVYNVTGRKNAYSVYFSSNGGERVSGYMLSVFATQIPYVNLNLKF